MSKRLSTPPKLLKNRYNTDLNSNPRSKPEQSQSQSDHNDIESSKKSTLAFIKEQVNDSRSKKSELQQLSRSEERKQEINIQSERSSNNPFSLTSRGIKKKPISLQIDTKITEVPELENSPEVQLKIQDSNSPGSPKTGSRKNKFQLQIRQAPRYYEESHSSQDDKKSEKLEEEIAKVQHKEIMKKIGAAEPIYELTHKYAQGSDSPAWKRKQMRHKSMQFKNIQEDPSKESMTLSSDEEEQRMPGEKNSQEEEGQKKNIEIQEKLQRLGEKIPILNKVPINNNKFSDLFGYQIYEGYKPNNLAQTKDYLDFLTRNDDTDDCPDHVKEYLKKEVETDLPEFINQKHILRFDQNFECGNLDSAYIHNCEEYNLQMKVDSNTKGNTYWFYFGVQNFRLDVTYTFNIYNYTRSFEKFYSQGMNILTKSQNISNQDEKNEWRYGTCKNICFEPSFIPRGQTVQTNRYLSVEERYRYFYGKLSFSYTFTKEDLAKQVLFAYAIPYSYTDLKRDLINAKNILMAPRESNCLSDERGKESSESPTLKILENKNYFNYEKYKKLGNYQNEEFNIASPLIGEGQDDSNRKNKTLCQKKVFLSPSHKTKKVSAYDILHDQITRQGNQQMSFKSSNLEYKYIQNEDKMKDLFLKDAFDKKGMKEQNFLITNNYLYYKQEVIAQSMGGLNIYQITITKRREAGSIRHSRKQIIYIQARLHAAETHGSFIMSSIIEELTKNYEKYDLILNNHIIKLVPMINPDGVVIGNSRSSLAGVDLNRRWCNPNATMHPELYFLKQTMKAISKQSKGITIFCDLHGHNKMQNCFFYGCNKAPNEGLLSWTKTRLLPKVLASFEPVFDFKMCKFSQEKAKYNTARVVIWNEFKVTNSFTLETSMYGKKKNQNQRRIEVEQLKINDFQGIGINLINSIKQFIVLNKKLEKEFSNTGTRWLKKKKLDEITGVTARMKMETNQRMEKQKKNQIGEVSPPKEKKAQKKISIRTIRRQSFAQGDFQRVKITKKENSQMNIREIKSKQKERSLPKQSTENKLQVDDMSLKSDYVSQEQSNYRQGFSSQKDPIRTFKLNDHQRANQKDDQSNSPIKSVQMPECLEAYFTQNEYEKAVLADIDNYNQPKKIQAQEESDSEPSCDNVEVREVFEEALSDDDKQLLEESHQTLKVVKEESSEHQGKDKQNYDKIAQQLQDVQKTSKQLHETLQSISREVNKKIDNEKQKARVLQSNMIVASSQMFRGNWDQIKANLLKKQSQPKREKVQVTEIPQTESAGPKSGQIQSITNRLNTQQQENRGGPQLPAVGIYTNEGFNRVSTTSAAGKQSKSKSRNSVNQMNSLNVSSALSRLNHISAQTHYNQSFLQENQRKQVNGSIILGKSMFQNEKSPQDFKRHINYAENKNLSNFIPMSKRQTIVPLEIGQILPNENLSRTAYCHQRTKNVIFGTMSPEISNQMQYEKPDQLSENQNLSFQRLADIDIKRQQIQNSPLATKIQTSLELKQKKIISGEQNCQITEESLVPSPHTPIQNLNSKTQPQTSCTQLYSPPKTPQKSTRNNKQPQISFSQFRQSLDKDMSNNQQNYSFFNIKSLPKVIIKPSQINNRIPKQKDKQIGERKMKAINKSREIAQINFAYQGKKMKKQMEPLFKSHESPHKMFELEEDTMTSQIYNQQILQEALLKRRGDSKFSKYGSRNIQIENQDLQSYQEKKAKMEFVIKSPKNRMSVKRSPPNLQQHSPRSSMITSPKHQMRNNILNNIIKNNF